MDEPFLAWLERDLERRAATQRTQIEAAKLVATLAVGVAGTMVASALQSGRSRGLETVSLVATGAAILAVVVTILLDRSLAVDHVSAMKDRALGEEAAASVLQLRKASVMATLNNDRVVVQVRWAAIVTVLLALVASALAAAAML